MCLCNSKECLFYSVFLFLLIASLPFQRNRQSMPFSMLLSRLTFNRVYFTGCSFGKVFRLIVDLRYFNHECHPVPRLFDGKIIIRRNPKILSLQVRRLSAYV
jgi:hypothetical protein